MYSERRTQGGWVLYDFANSTYHLMMPTVLMPLYFRQFLAAEKGTADMSWAILVSLTIFCAGVVGPFLGAFSDLNKCRFPILVATALGAIVFACLVPFTGSGAIVTGGLAFGISYFFFTLSLGIYDSFLPLISERRRRGALSGLGWGIGYIGGFVALCFIYPILSGAELPGGVRAFRTSIWITCIIYAVFSAPSFLLLGKDRSQIENLKIAESLGGGMAKSAIIGASRVVSTLRQWRQNKDLFKALLSYYLANDGLATLVYFTSIYAATTLRFNNRQILFLFIIVQAVGIPSSIIGGFLADRVGHKKILFSVLGLWVALCIGFAVSKGISTFYILAVGTGLVIGTTPAVYRSYLAEFFPEERAAELYGFNSFASRASSVLGPLLFGAIASMAGSQRPAMLSLLLFFCLAAIVLKSVNSKKMDAIKRGSIEQVV